MRSLGRAVLLKADWKWTVPLDFHLNTRVTHHIPHSHNLYWPLRYTVSAMRGD